MSFVISDQKSELLRDTNTVGNRVTDDDIILAFKRTNQYFTEQFKMPTTQSIADLLLFDGVYEYPLPSNMDTWMEPERWYGEYTPDFVHSTEHELVLNSVANTMAFKYSNGSRYGLFKYQDGYSALFHNCDTFDQEGTWTISGDGSNIVTDQNIYLQGLGSIRFNITASSGTTTLVITDAPTFDLTDYLTSYCFLDLQCPSSNTAAITSITVRVGDDALNYYEVSAVVRYRGDSILGGWGLIGFNMEDKTTFGSPSNTSTNYFRIVINHGTTGINGVYRLDNIFFARPVYFQLPYYTKYNVVGNDNVYKQYPTSLDDTILCPPDFLGAFYFKALEHIAIHRLQNQGIATYAARELKPKEDYLKASYPSQKPPIQTIWYRQVDKF